jgi:hypothetical protein
MATTTISNLPALAVMTDSSAIPVDTGTDTFKMSGANLKNYFGTGNVTFNDINIIGTGNLKLQPDSANASAYLDIFLTAGPDIHIAGNGETVILGTDDFANVAVNVNGNVSIQANAGTSYTWTFDTTGTLTVPGNLVIAGNTNVFGTDAALIYQTDGLPIIISSSGANGAVATVWAEDVGNIDTSNIAAVYANPTVGSGIVRIAVGQNGGGGPNLWDFDTTGNLTFPDSSVQTTAYTGAATSVPSQTILPTIQTITVEARPAGLFGGGQGGANVTVSNTIPVTEYGVIITDGTVSEKYKTGSLGSIPGTVSLTFTTGLNSTQFTVFAYVTSNAGTFYSNSATGTSGICLLAGTQIALSDGSYKAIEDITYTDKMLSWDFDRGCYAETSALWIKRGETGSQYNLLTFSDDTTLRTFDQHRIFNKQAGAFTYPMTDATPIGTITVNEHGQEITLINKQVIVDNIEYYNVITDYHMNLFSDSVLTSCRFNNIYPITDMKFVKDARTLRTRDEFENIPDRFFYGLRLSEQTTDIETVEWYVNRLLLTEMLTKYEITV